MGYSGYDQILCVNGHYDERDAFEYTEFEGNHNDVWKCPTCGEKAVWWNGVNTTNGSFEYDPEAGVEVCIDGHINLEIKKLSDTCTCNKCGCVHTLETVTYEVPEYGGHILTKNLCA